MNVLLCVIAAIVANWYYFDMQLPERLLITLGAVLVTALISDFLGLE